MNKQLELDHDSLKIVQKVKLGLAIVPNNKTQAEKILEKASRITAIIGGEVEKAEKSQIYVIDHVS